jgi:hypothetical protein
MFREVDQLMTESLSKANPFISPGVISSCNLGESRGLATFPSTNPLDLFLAGIVTSIEAITGGTDIGAYLAM